MKLFDLVRAALRTRHYSIRTEEAYVGWIRRFVVFHGKRHPDENGRSRDQRLRLASRHGREGGRFHPDAGLERASLPLPRSPREARRVPRRRSPRETPGAPARRPHAGRGEGRPRAARRDAPSRHDAPLRHRPAPHGVPAAASEGRRLRAQPDPRARRQGHEGPTYHASRRPPAAAPAPPGGRQGPPRGRPPRGLRQRLSARRPRAAISGRGQVVGLAGDLPRRVAQRRPASGRRLSPAPPPSGRNARPTRRPARRARGPPRKARKLPHPAAFLRHTPPRERLGHPHHPGAPRPPRRCHHHDLYTRPEPRRPRRHQPAGPDVSSSSGVVGSCLKPGRKGTRKLLREFGPRLVCVRYRYDERKRTRMKTVELVVEEVPWIPGSARRVFVDVKYGEVRLRAAMRNAGGRGSPEKRLWEIRYDRAVKLGLCGGILIAGSSLETTPRKLPSAETEEHPPAETSPGTPS